MIIKSRHNPLIGFFFWRYLTGLIPLHFSSIDIFPDTDAFHFQDPDCAVMIISNHYSWWDGIFIYYLNKKVFKKKFHAMVLKRTLDKNWALRQIGCFSINPGTRSVLDSFHYAGEILKEKGNLLLIYPQGKIESNYVETVHFRKGIERLAAMANQLSELVFVAGFVENFSNVKPSPSLYIGRFTDKDHIAEGYNDFYKKSRSIQSKRCV